MAYNILVCANITELATRRGNANPLIGAILGPNYPLDEAFAVYEWKNTDTSTPDGYEIIASTSGDTTTGRWHRVDNSQLPQVNSDWNATSGPAAILNKPSIPAAQVASDWSATTGVTRILNKPVIPSAQVNVDWTASTGVTQILNKPTFSAVATSGAYSDLSGRPTFSTVATSGAYADLSGKPTIPAAQVNADWTATSGVSQIVNKPTFATVATTGSYADLTGKPILSTLATSGNWADITSKPTFATVSTSGSYADLNNKPVIPAAQVNSDWSAASGVAQILNKPALATVAMSGNYSDLNAKPSLSLVATSGSYNDLADKPSIPTAMSFAAPVAKTVVLATAYQATNPAKPAVVTITLTSTSTFSLGGTVNNIAALLIGPTNAVATGTGTSIGSYENTVGGALTVGLNLSNKATNTYTLTLPAGWWYAVRQTTGTGITVVNAFDQVVG